MAHLVILPGWMHTSDQWQPMLTNLSTYSPTIIELPGFGEEPLISDDWGIPEYAKYVQQKITQLGLKKIILLGHSFGGRIAAYLASSNPEWLSALILYGAPCIYRPTQKVKVLSKVASIAKKLGFSSRLARNSELLAADNAGLGKTFRKAIPFDQTSRLPHIKVPTLLLWGEQDTEAPLKLAREMQKLIPNARLEILEKAGHELHLTHPYLFYAKITHFIENL